jgi:predicted unusual protein kinase regulating ubiquinone biosynthesis (AarF/ABC1/UbiB family)
MSERAAERLAEELCRLRGAGLKLGQMLSIQVMMNSSGLHLSRSL